MPQKDPEKRREYQRNYKRSLRGSARDRRRDEYMRWTNEQMARLSAGEQETAKLYFYAGLPAKVIASMLGITEIAVRKRVQMIRKKILG